MTKWYGGMMLAFILAIGSVTYGASPGTVSVVIAIDTEPPRIAPWQHDPVIDLSAIYGGKETRVAGVMQAAWRTRYQDSFGGHPRFTWFIMSHEAFGHTPDGNYAVIYDAMSGYDSSIGVYGDEPAWHYHHAGWFDADGDGRSQWNQITTFDGTPYPDGGDVELAERQLNYLLVERRFFPVAFRAGWSWENNDFSAWLDGIFPFDYSAYPPNRGEERRQEPIRNRYDWSRAPQTYGGYHPDRRDYQQPGAMHRWVFRTVAPCTAHEFARVFEAARDVGDQVLCLTCHSYDDLAGQIGRWLTMLTEVGDSLGVPYRYTSASEAGARMAVGEDRSHLEMHFERRGDTLAIIATSEIFQSTPYCAVKDKAGKVRRVFPTAVAATRWRLDLPPGDGIEVVCGASTLGGEAAVASYRPVDKSSDGQ